MTYVVGIRQQGSEYHEGIPKRLRWLGLAAAFSCGLVGSMLFGPVFFSFSSIQILGAVVGAYSPRVGSVLLWLGACILTFYASLFLGRQALGAFSVLRDNGDLGHVALVLLLFISLVLLVWHDIALVIFAMRRRRAGLRGVSPKEEHGFPCFGDWILWVVALGFSAFSFRAAVWNVLAYRRVGGLGSLLLAILPAFGIALFDVTLVVSAVKTWRAQRSDASGT